MAMQCSVQPHLIMIDTGLITDMLQTMDTWSPTAGYLPGSASSFAKIIWDFFTEVAASLVSHLLTSHPHTTSRHHMPAVAATTIPWLSFYFQRPHQPDFKLN